MALSTSRSYPTRENTRSKLLPGTFYPQCRYLAPCPTLAGTNIALARSSCLLCVSTTASSSVPRWIRLLLTGASPSFCTRPCHLGFATETLFSPLLCLQFLRSPLASLACSLPYGPTTPQPVMPPALSIVCCTSVFDCSSNFFAVPFTVRPASSALGFLISWQCPRLAALVTLYPSNLRCVTSWVPFSKVSHEQRLLLLSPLALNNHHHRRMTDNDQKNF